MRQIATDELPPPCDAISFVIYFYISGACDDKLEFMNADFVLQTSNGGLAPEPG
jgi:hypothetical protein